MVVHNYYLLALLLIHSLRMSICVYKYLYMLSANFDDRGWRDQWPYLLHRPHQVQPQGHFPCPWNFIYNPQKLLYLSWSWFQFFIPDRDITKDERAIEYHLPVMLAEKQRRGEHSWKIWRGQLVDNMRGLEENVREVDAGLEKIPISQGLVTLLDICRVIPTPQSPISPETPPLALILQWKAPVSSHRAPMLLHRSPII